MNFQDAVETAARWWVDRMFDGTWDNGDPKTESIHAMFKRHAAQVREADRERLLTLFRGLVGNETSCPPPSRQELYSDYGNHLIDAAFRDAGLPYCSRLHCPQKAGTLLRANGEKAGEDDWIVTAKNGYGQPNIVLPVVTRREERDGQNAS